MTENLVNWQTMIGDTVNLRVIPKATSNRIKPERAMDGTLHLRVYVTVVAEDGKANEAVIKLLSKALKVPKSALTIQRGALSQNKVIKIIR